MSEHQQVFDVSELQSLSYTCSKCGTVVIFKVLTDERFGLPAECPTCRESMEAAARAFGAYRTFYRLAMEKSIPIRLYTKASTGAGES